MKIQKLYFTVFLVGALGCLNAWSISDTKEEVNSSSENPARIMAAKSPRRNALALELLGRGGLYSLNYDYSISDNLAIGAGAAMYSSGSASLGVFPIFANYYGAGENHRLLFTAGPTIVTASANVDSGTVKGSGIAGTFGVGYEYRADGGFLFRAVPYLNVGAISGVWFGLTGGYTF